MPRKTEAASTPAPKFRGTWAPADLFLLIRTKEVSHSEFVLTLQIDALVESGKGGCWATNRYLATELGLTPRHVQRMLQKLTAMGLVKTKSKKGSRYLETAWSSVKVKRWSGGGGIYATPHDIDVVPPTTSMSPNKYRHKNKRQNSPSAAPPPSGVSGKDSKMLFDEPAGPDKLHLALAQRLRDWTVKNKSNLSIPTRWSPQTWANDMRILADSVGLDTASQRLDYLLTNNPSAVTPGLPTPVNAKIFRSAAVQTWIMKHMEKSGAVANGAVATPADQKLVDRILALDWPADKLPRIKATVYPAVLASRKTLVAFVVSADRLLAADSKSIRNVQFRYALTSVAKLKGHENQIIRDWFRRLSEATANWSEWQGDLLKYALTADSRFLADWFWTQELDSGCSSSMSRFLAEVQ